MPKAITRADAAPTPGHRDGLLQALVRLTHAAEALLACQALRAPIATGHDDGAGGPYLNDASGGGSRERAVLRALLRQQGQAPPACNTGLTWQLEGDSPRHSTEAMASGQDGAVQTDPLNQAVACFRALQTYQVTLHARDRGGNRHVSRYFYRKPGWVRMELIQPYRGMVLIYDPAQRRVRVWPFGTEHKPVLHLSPDDPMLRQRHGHRIDRSDIGALLDNVRSLSGDGQISLLRTAHLGEHEAVGVDIAGAPGMLVGQVHRYRLWLAQPRAFPVRIETYGADGIALETVDLADLKVDGDFAHNFFAP